jgi:hypothetical protein
MKSRHNVGENIVRVILLGMTPFLLVLGTASGPSLLQVGPFDLVVFDLGLISYLSVFAIFLLTGGQIRKKVFLNGAPLYVYIFYIASTSLLGAIIFDYSLSFLTNEMRWVIIAILYTSVGAVLSSEERKRRLLDLFFKLTVVFSFVFVILQVLHSLGISAGGILEWWYKDYDHPNRPYGYYLGRFSGAAGGPSSLGVVSAASGLWFWMQYAEQRAKGAVTFLLLSMILLLASGTRTSMVAFVVAWGILASFGMSVSKLKKLVVPLAGAGVAILVGLWVGIGRIESGRYSALIDILTGEISYSAVSGRAPAWSEVLSRSGGVVGTLANPSYVYEDIVIDSYFLHAYAQGGILLLLVFAILLVYPIIKWMSKKNRDMLGFSVVLSLMVAICCINQNFMTGLAGRSIIMVLFLSTLTANSGCANKFDQLSEDKRHHYSI